MIIVDTNVVSELMRPKPSPAVIEWIGKRPSTSHYTTSITQAEVFHGILLLPAGRRRSSLYAAAQAMFEEDFSDRVLAFGPDAAMAYAAIAVERRHKGHPISHFDAQIAAIARAAGASVATRNVTDFAGCGVTVENPWGKGT